MAEFVIAKYWTIKIGTTNSSIFSNKRGEQRFGVEKIIVHPGFNSTKPHFTMDNDIALMKLDRPAILTDNVSPLCLPNVEPVNDGRRCMIVGWGLISGWFSLMLLKTLTCVFA